MPRAIDHLWIGGSWRSVNHHWSYLLPEYFDDCWQTIYLTFVEHLEIDPSTSHRKPFNRLLARNLYRLSRDLGFSNGRKMDIPKENIGLIENRCHRMRRNVDPFLAAWKRPTTRKE